MVLLEAHLSNEGVTCSECVKKRFLLMEALAEEVNQNSTWATEANGLAMLIRRWQIAFSDEGNTTRLRGKIEKRRRDLVEVVFRPSKG